jgi:hypothetical protein
MPIITFPRGRHSGCNHPVLLAVARWGDDSVTPVEPQHCREKSGPGREGPTAKVPRTGEEEVQWVLPAGRVTAESSSPPMPLAFTGACGAAGRSPAPSTSKGTSSKLDLSSPVLGAFGGLSLPSSSRPLHLWR